MISKRFKVPSFLNSAQKNYSIGIVLLFLCQFSFSQTNYYIDSIAGNDANSGSITTPFKSVSKLNNMTLAAGSKVYLKCGCTWTSQTLKFKGSGTAGNPIIIDKYGNGAIPLLAGNGITGDAVVYLYNQQYIEINNLEITNCPVGPVNSAFFVGLYQNGTNPLGADRRGVMVALDNYGTANHIYLKNLNIHHIKGQLGSISTAVNGAYTKRTGGIYFDVLGNTEKTTSKSRFNDVLIDSCSINYCENIGLAFDNEWNTYYPGGNEYANWYSRRYTNVKISNNTIHHIGKNAMIIRCTDSTGLIEHNVCYETAVGTTGNTMFTARARGTVFQYNEGYYNRANTQTVDPGSIDGSMYDPDLGSINIIFQFSYSHDNSEGLYWGCNSRSQPGNTAPSLPDPLDLGCTARYNISQNDLGDLVYFNYPSAGNEIYNNVFYSKSGLGPIIIHENGRSNHSYNFKNNIIFNLTKTSSSGARYVFVDTGVTTQNRTIDHNLFWGSHPSTEPVDSNKLTTNPLFINPGSGGLGLNTLSGYQIKSTSPCINSGVVIPNTATSDFWGNPVPGMRGLPPCRGAFEFNTPWPTPVSFVSFSGTNKQNHHVLTWTTINETNNAGFEVQVSNDGLNFSDVAFVKAQTATGNYVGQLFYSYSDANNREGNTYYRLKQLDKNGISAYSSVIMMATNKIPLPSIAVYPNPVKGSSFKMQLKNMTQGNYTLKVLNQTGKVISIQPITIQDSNADLKVELSGVQAKGVYLLQLNNRTLIVKTKFIVE